MRVVTVKVEGVSPFMFCKPVLEKPAQGETHDAKEERTWRGRIHKDPATGQAYIPAMAWKNGLAAAAKRAGIQIPGQGKARYTKHFESGILVLDNVVLPIKADDVPGDWRFVPSSGISGDGKRVMKCFPYVAEWGGTVEYYVIDPVITEDVFAQVMEQFGQFVGVGMYRPENRGIHGRFAVRSIKWGTK
jgi:hypothetical protein